MNAFWIVSLVFCGLSLFMTLLTGRFLYLTWKEYSISIANRKDAIKALETAKKFYEDADVYLNQAKDILTDIKNLGGHHEN